MLEEGPVSRRRLLAAGVFAGAAGMELLRARTARAAVDPDLQQQIDTLYALREGEDVKAVRPPFPVTRQAYYEAADPDQVARIPAGPTAMYFRWRDGRAHRWGNRFGGAGTNFPDLMRLLVNVYPQEIEGDAKLLEKELPGDWVVREGAKPETVVRQLQPILKELYRLPVRAEFREVDRKVYVAQGRFQYQPLPGRERNRIELYARELTEPNRGGGGSGDLKECLNWVGMFINRRVVSEVPDAAQVDVEWHHNEVLTSDAARAANREPAGVLRHFTEQTGITFQEATRKVRVLFLEPV